MNVVYPLASDSDYIWNGYIDTINIRKIELYFGIEKIATSENLSRYSFFYAEKLKTGLPYSLDLKKFSTHNSGIPIYINSKIWIKCHITDFEQPHSIKIYSKGTPELVDVINVPIRWDKKITLSNSSTYYKDGNLHNILHLDFHGNVFLVF